MTAVEIAEGVRSGRLRARAVVEEHLARIRRFDDALGAFEVVTEAAALAEAEAVDARLDRSRLPLAGVPVAIKDNIDVAGVPTRQGSAAVPQRPAAADDDLVRRLRAAGAVVVGKTRMPEFAIWPFTETATSVSRNPWHPGLTPGGSTGGGAVAVATGMAAVALGSDGGGSLRVPAACCGIVGIKPAPGLVPPAGGAPSHWYGLTAFGPLARTVSDAALVLDVLAGRSVGSPSLPPPPLRIAVSVKHPLPGGRVAAEVARATFEVAERLGREGHQVVASDPPYPPDAGLRFSRRWLAGIAEDALVADPARLEDRTRRMVRAGRFLRARGWAQPAEREPWRRRAGAWFEAFDALLMPTLAGPPVPIGRWRGQGWIRTTLGSASWIMTAQWNLAGWAAASVPVGLDSRRLPLAVQLVVRPGAEEVLVRLAAQVERLHPAPEWTPEALDHRIAGASA